MMPSWNWKSLACGDVNGSHWIMTQVLAYDRREDRFQSLFVQTVGSNNNQEIRVIEHGPLAGDIVIAEPTTDAPYGYWITVLSQDSATYRERMWFRSATHYGGLCCKVLKLPFSC
ncbi:hypothetical protein D5366_11545 (plasmid) [Neokomagataea tanensis]|uniref:Uncharacterized protein n=1 Tax=Neokomagataea tanensis TaxID=661191 RepID=A0A4Y6V7L3_9PROT|nr:hypothetical protein D5366_11545 [Neokomagataea tanensis]